MACLLPSSRRWITASAIALALGIASTARADHPSIEAAIAHEDEADFAGALAAFAEAEASGALTRDDLVLLFGHRAVVHFALGERAAMDADLARLLALGEGAELPGSAPPPVHDELERLRGDGVRPPRLSVEVDRQGRRVEVRAAIEDDRAQLVRSLVAHVRSAGSEAFVDGDAGVATIEAHAGDLLEWYAEAYGPGGAVVASEGTALAPRSYSVPADVLVSPSPRTADEDDGSVLPWLALGGGVVVAVVVAVALVAGDPDSASVGRPTLEL